MPRLPFHWKRDIEVGKKRKVAALLQFLGSSSVPFSSPFLATAFKIVVDQPVIYSYCLALDPGSFHVLYAPHLLLPNCFLRPVELMPRICLKNKSSKGNQEFIGIMALKMLQ